MDWTISVTLLRIELFLVGVFNILWKKALFARFPVSSYKKRDNFSWYCEQDIASRPAMSTFFCVGISFPTRLPWCPRFGDRVRHKSHQQTAEKNQVFFFFWWIFLVFLLRACPGMTTRVGSLARPLLRSTKGVCSRLTSLLELWEQKHFKLFRWHHKPFSGCNQRKCFAL